MTISLHTVRTDVIGAALDEIGDVSRRPRRLRPTPAVVATIALRGVVPQRR